MHPRKTPLTTHSLAFLDGLKFSNATAIIAESANKAAEASQDTATPASAADVRDGNHKDHTAADASHAAATAADVSMEDDVSGRT